LSLANKEKIGVMNETTPFEREERQEAEIAFHNADVPKEERDAIEKAFREGKLPVLVATSTLAYGVNLPADTVLIGVRAFYDRNERKWKTFPDVLDILQMEGRAGRLGIKEKGFSYILPYGVREENLKREIEKRFDEGFKPYLKQESFSGDVFKVISLFILLGFLYEGENFRKFLERTYSLRDLAYSPRIDAVWEWLKERGYITEGKLSEKALFCIRSGLPPQNYEEFLRRKQLGLETMVYVRPLLFTKRFDGLYDFVRKGETFEEDDAFVKQKLLPCAQGCFEDNTQQFLFYIEGLTFKYRNIQNPPGEFSYLGTDALHLLRTMLEIRQIGDLPLTNTQMLAVAHSVKYGITPEYTSLGGLKGIGHIRANLLKRLLHENNINPPALGSPTEKLIEELLSHFSSENALLDALAQTLIVERYRDASFERKAIREARSLLGVLKRNKEGFLIDDRLLFAFGLLTLGDKALKMKKKELIEEVLQAEHSGV